MILTFSYFAIVPIPFPTTYTAWKVSIFGVILVRTFPLSDWTRRDTQYVSVFRSNAGKCRPELLRIRTVFTQCEVCNISLSKSLFRSLLKIYDIAFLGNKFRQKISISCHWSLSMPSKKISMYENVQ